MTEISSHLFNQIKKLVDVLDSEGLVGSGVNIEALCKEIKEQLANIDREGVSGKFTS